MLANKKEPKDKPILTCPHCGDFIIIMKINCGIFRHGVLIENGKQIDPHSPKDLCDYYARENKIYGCGKPFRIVRTNEDDFYTEICDYI
jgi:hypothetical protein